MRTLIARLRALGPARIDALVAAAFAVEVSLELTFGVSDHPRLGIVIACLLVLAVALALRRRKPLLATAGALFVLTAAFVVLPTTYTENLTSPFFMGLFLLYSAGRYLDDRTLLVVAVLAAISQVLDTAVDKYDDSLASYATGVIFIACAPILIGRFIRHRAALDATLRAKAAALRSRHAERAEAAAAEERTRIAGELHDVVAHALSAMVVQAGGARRLAERDPGQAAVGFLAVERTGREALTEIRRLLGVLRREDEELALAPQPSLRHVSSLVARMKAAGLPVELTVEGEERELPAGIDLTAYRVLQEALKAALGPGGAGRAAVRLRFAADHVSLRVDDDGTAAVRALPGVPERVALYGGRLRTGARREGGHVVRARLPVEVPA